MFTIIYEGERLINSPSPIFYKRGALICEIYFPIRMCCANQTMWNCKHHYNRLQQGAGNYENSEESDFSQESEVSSQGKESSQEETEHL